MRSGFKIGKLFGIQIRVDWSWLVIFFLATWNLGTAFGNLHSDWSFTLRWGLALVTALLFFASVLMHELGHALVARSHDIPVRNITLHLFGGVSNIQREPASAGSEFVMAILGPLTSFVIGSIFLVIFALTSNMSTPFGAPERVLEQVGPVSTMVLWLGTVNVGLGLFNLIPGFPLDGGRILRSFFWAVTNNLKKATRWASRSGQLIAWLLIFSGIAMTFGARIPLLGTGLSDGLWLAFIGWFLHNAAVQSYQQLMIRDILEDVPVAELMRKTPPIVSPTSTVATLVHNYVMENDDYAFPVMEDGQLQGLVTLDDVRAVTRDAWETTHVQEIMTPAKALITIEPEENTREALDRLSQRDVRQLPVMHEGALEGLLRRRDIVKWLQLQSEMDIA